jgi:hypothetical protein
VVVGRVDAGGRGLRVPEARERESSEEEVDGHDTDD